LRWVLHLFSGDFSENERNMQKICCHSCILSGFCREMMWLQNRNSKSRAKTVCSWLYGIRLGSMLSTDFQMIAKWIATISWQIYLFLWNKWSFLEEVNRMKNNWWFRSTIALFTQVGVQQIGSKNMIFTACQTNTIHIIWLLVTCTCFLQSKKTRTDSPGWWGSVSWVPARGVEKSGSTRIESHISSLDTPSSRIKRRQ
jgi:hypothetical protein